MSNYVSELEKYGQVNTKLTNDQKSFLISMNNQKMTYAEMQTSLKGLEKATKAATIAQNLLNAALTTIAITVAIKTIDAIINYQKRMVEQTKAAIQTYKDEKEAISQTTTKIKELYDKINSGQLSYDEHVEANRQLLDIQKEMIDNYGSQVEGINLVTTSIKDQTDAINEYQKAASRAAYYNMQNQINEDTNEQKFFQGAAGTLGQGLMSMAGGLPGLAYSTYANYKKYNTLKPWEWNSGVIQDIVGTNTDKQLEEFLNKKYEIEITADEKANKVIANFENVTRDGNKFEITGNADQVRKTIDNIRVLYPELIKESDSFRKSLDDADRTAQNIQTDYGELYKVTMDWLSADYQGLIDTANKAYDAYVKAITPNAEGIIDQDAIRKAEENYRNAIRDINNSVEDLDVRDYILNQFQSIDIAATKIEDDFNNIKNVIDNYTEDINEETKNNPLVIPIKTDIDFDNPGSFISNEFEKFGTRLSSATQEYNNAIENSWGKLYQKIAEGNLTAYDLLTTTDQELIDLLKDLATKYDIVNIPEFIELLEKLQIIQNGKNQLAAKKVLGNYNVDDARSRQEKLKLQEEYADWLQEQGEEFQNWVLSDLVIPDNVIYSHEELLALYDEWIHKSDEAAESTKRFAYQAVDSLAETESAINSLADLYWEVVEKDPNADEDSLANWGIADPAKINAVEQAFSKLAEKEDEVTQEKLSLALKDFEETLVHFPGDEAKAEEAINKLITTFINESDILDDLTEENQEYIKARLESIGVTNAEEVVQSRLEDTIKYSTVAIKELREEYNKYYETLKNEDVDTDEYKNAIDDLTSYVSKAIAFYNEDGTYEELFKISPEFVQNHLDTVEKMLDGDEDALRELQKEVAKMKFKTDIDINVPEQYINDYFNELWDMIDWTNLQEIDIGADLNNEAFIAALNQMANGSWQTAQQIAEYFKAIGIDLKMNQQFGKTGGGGMPAAVAAMMDARGPFSGATKSGNSGVGKAAEYKPQPTSSKDKGGGSDKEEEDPIVKAYEDAMAKLQFLRDNNFISEKEYYDQLRLLAQKLFGDNLEKYAENYYNAIKEYLEGILELYKSAQQAAVSLLDAEIDKYNELEEKEKKVFEEEKEANEKKIKGLNKEIKLLDKEIKNLQKQQETIRENDIKPLEDTIKERQKLVDSINEEVELMEKANEARNDSLELQKLQYQMERASHQKNLLVNILCQPIQ